MSVSHRTEPTLFFVIARSVERRGDLAAGNVSDTLSEIREIASSKTPRDDSDGVEFQRNPPLRPPPNTALTQAKAKSEE
jgi:hypothetical protein